MSDVDVLRHFIGNPDAYAEQNSGGGYTPIRSTLTDVELSEHLDGLHTYGSYVLWKDKAKYMVFDVDTNDLPLAKTLAAECERLGFHPGIEFSGKKGFHVWVLFTDYHPAADIRRIARYIAEQVGFNGEVFPKQDVTVDLGNLVKLPLGVHQVSGERSRFLSMPAVHDQSRFQAAFDQTPVPVAKAKSSWGPQPCLDSIQDNPPGPGERDNCMFHFVAMMRRAGLDGEQLEAAANALNDRMPKPLDARHLDGIIKNTEDRGPICDQLPIARQCGADCIKKKQGISIRSGEVRHAPEGKNIVVQLGKPIPGGSAVEVKHPDVETGYIKLKRRY